MKIVLIPYLKDSIRGIDVAICDDEATVGDYSRAMEQYILDGDFVRFRDKKEKCEGCDLCCQERIPLTSIDVLRLKERLAPGLSWQDFFKRYSYVVVSGRAVDISLSRDFDNKCICLDKAAKKCLFYGERPFVCRTYICASSSPRAAKLREAVINTGMDELVRLWFEQGKNGGLVIHESFDPAVREEDWKESAWTGKADFNKIPLREIVAADLWKELRGKENKDNKTNR